MIPKEWETNGDISYLMGMAEKITPDRIKRAVMACLENAPEYFWTSPASITGKHHELYALGEGGLVRHTIAATEFGINLARYDVEIEAKTWTYIVPALILHDITKYGIGNTIETKKSDPNMYWFNNHHLIAASFCRQIWYKMVANDKEVALVNADEIRWLEICNLVFTHTGRWGSKPATKEGWIVHFSDMAAATRLPDICHVIKGIANDEKM